MSEIPEWAVTEAANIAREWQWEGHHDFQVLRNDIARIVSAAYTRGQMDMRERAARISEMHSHQGVIAEAIRSLPLQDEEGK